MKEYRITSEGHAQALGKKVGDTYKREYHPDHERALKAGGHVVEVKRKEK